MEEFCEKYGLTTAISIVVGAVIGSGVFFKAEEVCRLSGGNGTVGTAAWLIGGAVMLLCLLSFSLITSQIGSGGGLVEIAEKTTGESFAYYTGWFMATIYYPSLVSVLSWLSARYTLLFFGMSELSGGLCMTISCFYMIVIFSQNVLFPSFSGKFQSVTTALKIIPLVLMIVLGINEGIRTENFTNSFSGNLNFSFNDTFSAVTTVMFAYEGWIAVTGIGQEIKNSRRNLPLALILGGVTVGGIYVLYYIGILGAIEPQIFFNYGTDAIKIAFENVAGKTVGGLLMGFVAVSCIGALNAMMMSQGRAMYFIARTGRGPAPKTFSQLLPKTNMPAASFVAGLTISMVWMFFLFGSEISEKPLFGNFGFDSSELPVITAYALYVPIFLSFIKTSAKEKRIGGIITPFLGVIASAFVIYCAAISHGKDVIDYLFVFASVMLAGAVFYRKKL